MPNFGTFPGSVTKLTGTSELKMRILPAFGNHLFDDISNVLVFLSDVFLDLTTGIGDP